MLRIVNVVGARPNFMKIAPLMKAMHQHPGVTPRLVHTGQHYDDNLSRVFFEELGIPQPDLNLGIGSGTREEQILAIQAAFRPVLRAEDADAVLVVGDVNSTIACASVAREQGVAVVHVEAGLRSFDLSMPEEVNRLETDRISDYLFVTEPSGIANLEREAVAGERHLVGNVMIDTLVANLPSARASDILKRLDLQPNRYMVATFHRPSNVDSRESLQALLTLLRQICDRVPVVLPVHPRTRASLQRNALEAEVDAIEGLITCEPLGYLDFIGLLSASLGAVTDSGGIQEETTYLRIPCLTLRHNTERPVTVDTGSNLLIGDDLPRLLVEVQRILDGEHERGEVPPLWDGHAAQRILEIIVSRLGATALHDAASAAGPQ